LDYKHIRVVLKAAGDAQAGLIDLSWEGEVELQLYVGSVLRGKFHNMDIRILNGIANRTDVTLLIDQLAYELISVERRGAFEAIAINLRLQPAAPAHLR
jgi:hypothetical protein